MTINKSRLGDLAMLSPYGIGLTAATAATATTSTSSMFTLALVALFTFIVTTWTAAQAATSIALHYDARHTGGDHA